MKTDTLNEHIYESDILQNEQKYQKNEKIMKIRFHSVFIHKNSDFFIKHDKNIKIYYCFDTLNEMHKIRKWKLFTIFHKNGV